MVSDNTQAVKPWAIGGLFWANDLRSYPAQLAPRGGSMMLRASFHSVHLGVFLTISVAGPLFLGCGESVVTNPADSRASPRHPSDDTSAPNASNALPSPKDLASSLDSLHREVHSRRSYQSHYGTHLQFGLRKADRVDRIEVNWIGWGSDVLEDIPADQCLIVELGSTSSAASSPAPQ